MLGVKFFVSMDDFVAKVEPLLASNRVSTGMMINLPSKKYPEMLIQVDFKRKSVFARMVNKNKQAYLNRYLTSL
jgi:hypothetical protein